MYQPLCTVEPLLFQHLKIWAGWPSQPLNICESPWGIHPVCWTIFKIIYYLKPPTSIIIEGVCILMYAYMYIVGYIYICIYIYMCVCVFITIVFLWYSMILPCYMLKSPIMSHKTIIFHGLSLYFAGHTMLSLHFSISYLYMLLLLHISFPFLSPQAWSPPETRLAELKVLDGLEVFPSVDVSTLHLCGGFL